MPWHNQAVDGLWRSLAARVLWEHEVAGSNPASPTSRLPRGLWSSSLVSPRRREAMSEDTPTEAPQHTEDHPEEPDRPVLRRSREDKVIAGVAGGLGRYLEVDPVILRIAFLVLAFFGGSGILLYLIGWIAIPLEEPGDRLGPSPAAGTSTTRAVVGALLVAVGALWLFERLVPGFGRFLGPLVLIGLGLVVLAGVRR